MFIKLHYSNSGKSNGKAFWLNIGDEASNIKRINSIANNRTGILLWDGDFYSVQETEAEIMNAITKPVA